MSTKAQTDPDPYGPKPCHSCGVVFGATYCETPGCPYEHWPQSVAVEDVEHLSLREISRKHGELAPHYWPMKPEPDARGVWRVCSDHLENRDWRKLREGAKVNWCREVLESRTHKGRYLVPLHHGYMVWAPVRGYEGSEALKALRDSGFSESLIHILEIAQRGDCVAVHFDPHAEPYPRLAVFE